MSVCESSYLYRAELDRVVDGDTVDLWVDLGFHMWTKQRFRLQGIDAPERFTASGKLATKFVEDMLTDKKLQIESRKTGKYGRWIAVVYIEGEKYDLSILLHEAGLAKEVDYD